MILKLESFCNEQGMLVQQRTMVSGPPAPFHQFLGTVGIGTEQGMQMMEFPIDANSIEEAFEKFRESADARLAKIKKEHRPAISEMQTGQAPQAKPASGRKGIVLMKKPSRLILPGQ